MATCDCAHETKIWTNTNYTFSARTPHSPQPGGGWLLASLHAQQLAPCAPLATRGTSKHLGRLLRSWSG